MRWTDQEHDELMEIVDALCQTLVASKILELPIHGAFSYIAERSKQLRNRTLGLENDNG